jgi:urease accessory protein
MMMQLSSTALVRLMHLASPQLPVGAYCYSQGLEWAVEEGVVYDSLSAQEWLFDVLQYNLARFEGPLLLRMQQAWSRQDTQQASDWNLLFCISRETAELRTETDQMGYSLAKLLLDAAQIGDDRLAPLMQLAPISFPAAFSFIAAEWQIETEAALHAYFWSWAENQVSAAIKLVPLGQVAGQKILLYLTSAMPGVIADAMQRGDDELCNFTPALAIASSRHETQYSRLFRS